MVFIHLNICQVGKRLLLLCCCWWMVLLLINVILMSDIWINRNELWSGSWIVLSSLLVIYLCYSEIAITIVRVWNAMKLWELLSITSHISHWILCQATLEARQRNRLKDQPIGMHSHRRPILGHTMTQSPETTRCAFFFLHCKRCAYLTRNLSFN